MNYVKQSWRNLPVWARTTIGAAILTPIVWGSLVNVGNALVAKHELDKGYTPIQADEQIRTRFGQYYPRLWDEITYTVGTLGRQAVYNTFDQF